MENDSWWRTSGLGEIHEKHRRTSILGVVGHIQREGDVLQVFAYAPIDLTAVLAGWVKLRRVVARPWKPQVRS